MGNAWFKVSQTTKTCNSCRHHTIFNYRITYTFLHKTFGLSLHMEGIHLMSNDSLLCFILIVRCMVSCLIYYMLLKLCPEYTINNILTGAPMKFIAIVLSASQILINVSNLLAWTGHFSYFYGWEQSLELFVFHETCILMSLLEEKTNRHFPFLSWHEAGAPSLPPAGIRCQGISTLDCFRTSLSIWAVCSINSGIFLGSRGRKQTTSRPNLPREGEKTTVWSSSLECVLQNEAAALWEVLCLQLLMCLHWECYNNGLSSCSPWLLHSKGEQHQQPVPAAASRWCPASHLPRHNDSSSHTAEVQLFQPEFLVFASVEHTTVTCSQPHIPSLWVK